MIGNASDSFRRNGKRHGDKLLSKAIVIVILGDRHVLVFAIGHLNLNCRCQEVFERFHP